MKIFVRILSVLLFLLVANVAAAQERVDPDPAFLQRMEQEDEALEQRAIRYHNNEYMKLQKPFATLSEATGWTSCSTDTMWVERQNAIFELDNFDKFEFGWTNYDDGKYLYIRKIYKCKDVDRDTNSIIDRKFITTYIFDIDEYINQVKDLDDGDHIIKLGVLHRYNDWLRETNDVFMGGRYLGEAGGYSNAINISTQDPRKYVFTIKFRLNKAKNTVRFFYYYKRSYKFSSDVTSSKIDFMNTYQSRDHDIYYMISLESIMNWDLSNPSPIPDIIKSDALYENFYYEAPADKFLKFIQAPLVQYEKETKKK